MLRGRGGGGGTGDLHGLEAGDGLRLAVFRQREVLAPEAGDGGGRIVAHFLLSRDLRPYLDSLDLVQSVHKSLLLGLRSDKFDISNPEKLVALALTMVRRKAARHWRHP